MTRSADHAAMRGTACYTSRAVHQRFAVLGDHGDEVTGALDKAYWCTVVSTKLAIWSRGGAIGIRERPGAARLSGTLPRLHAYGESSPKPQLNLLSHRIDQRHRRNPPPVDIGRRTRCVAIIGCPPATTRAMGSA
jgi:hypothetical protein